MDLSTKEIARIQADVESVVRSLHAAHLARGAGTFEHFLTYFEDDVIGVGTGKDEVVFNKKDLTTLLEREWSEVAASLHYVLHSVDVRVLSAESASAQSFIDIYLGDPGGDSFHARLSTVFRKIDGQWKAAHWHASTPWEIQPEGVSWPAEQLEAKALKLEQEVAARTAELSRANRELEVEAALERIRRVTASMNDPSDLIEVAKQIRREADVLYGGMLAEVGLMLEEDEENYRFWSILDYDEVPDNLDTFGLVYPKNSDQRHPLMDWLWDSTETYAVQFFDLDALWQMHASLAVHNPKEAEILKAALEGGLAKAWSSVSSIQSGRMYVIWVAEPPEELAAVQPRIAGVLSEAQQRVDELREAHRLKREAQFESALERIRRATGQMTNPSDVKLVLGQVKHEIESLFEGKVIEIAILREDENNIYSWNILDVTEDHAETTEQQGMPFPKDLDPPHPVLTKVFGRDDRFFQFQWGVESVMAAYNYAAERFPEMGAQLKPGIEAGLFDNMWSAISTLSDARFKTTWLSEPASEIASIQPRIADELDLAFRRVKELEEANRMAREAQIEASLERIRGRTMAMQSSEELGEVSILLDQEVRKLGPKTWGCAFNIYGEEDSTEWFGSEAGVQNPYRTPREKYFKEFYDRGQAGESFFIKEFPEGECAQHYDYMKTLPVLGDMLRGIEATGHSFPDSQIDHVAYFKYGYLLFITLEPSPEMHDVFQRFAKVFEQSYTRFLDLENAEAQAREAQIEAALERIRGRALAMRTSMELDDVADEIRRQMGLLGQKDLELCIIHIYDTGDDWWETWGAVPDPERPGEIVRAPMRRFPKKGLTIIEELIAAYESEETEHVFVNRGEKAANFFAGMAKYAPEHFEALSKLVEMAGMSMEDASAWWTFSDFNGGSIGMVTYQPAELESRAILKRIAKVFDLAYRRFKDLREAEEAEREAQIEASLERVRARAMSMQSSDELMDVAQVLFQQLIALGMDPAIFETCGFVIFRDGTKIGDTFLTQLDGSPLAYTFSAEYGGDRATREHYASWKKGEPITMVHLVGDQLPEHLDYLTEMSGEPINRFHEMAGVPVPPGSYNYSANFKHGYVAVITTVPMPEAEALYPRFAKVFEQAYTRFLDLKNAEAAAREAQIEAALERVRAQAMGMRNSDELLEVVATIHRQFSGLGLECGVFWHAHYYPDHYMKALTSVDGSKVTTLMRLPRDFSAVPELAVWERGTEPFAVFQFDSEAGGRYMDHMISKGHFLEVDPNAVTPDMVRDHGGITFVQARTSSGEIGYSLWGEADPEPEAEEVLLRFARVFDLAYRRYKDLTEAETAARESRVEVALERVRSRAMAMHDSVELSETIGVMFDQMKELGFTPVSTFLTLMDDDLEGMTFRMTGKDGSRSLTDIRWESTSMPQFLEVRDAWKRGEAILGAHYTGSSLDDFLSIIDPINNQLKGDSRLQASDFGNGLYSCSGRHAFGTLGILNATPVPEDQQDLLIRFAKEFELVYRRFLDLEKAEAQARESRIEASLERVRAQAMAMQKPEDISDVSIRMFDELEALGVESLRSGISIPQQGDRYVFHAATKDASGSTTLVLGDESVDVHPIIRRAYDGWKAQEPFQHTVLEGKDLVDYYHAVFDTMPLPDWKERMQRGEAATESFATFPFQDGWLYTFVRHEIDGAELDLYQRFARVFGLAYQRYHDLTKAEQDYAALLAEKARTEKALADLQATQKQLVEQEKLASLGSLTAGIAHEIKNPLNFVNNFAEVSTELMEELAEAVARGDTQEAAVILDDLRDNATQIAKHGKRADSIVRSMMQHARGGASEREMIDVNHFLEEYANLAWHGMRARDHGFQADVKRDFDPTAGSLQVMPQELGRVVLNLLNNAFDAIKTQDGAVVTVGSRRSEDGVTITVSDNGPGIPDEIRQKIFEPFFTTKATGEGTGLGLSLSYDIVTKGHGGTMTVGTSEQGGALFTITIPGGTA